MPLPPPALLHLCLRLHLPPLPPFLRRGLKDGAEDFLRLAALLLHHLEVGALQQPGVADLLVLGAALLLLHRLAVRRGVAHLLLLGGALRGVRGVAHLLYGGATLLGGVGGALVLEHL